MLEANPKKVKAVFKHYPLRNHAQARPAAAAAIAAGRQGKFWPYHDRLFKNYRKLNEQLYLQIANELGLDMEQFAKDRTATETLQQIQRDLLDGNNAGVRGTPTLFVNGRKVKQRGLKSVQMLIEKALASSPDP